MALEQSAWELMAIGRGLLKDREVLIDSARLLSIVVRRIVDSRNFEYNFYQAELPLMLKLKKTPALEREDVDPRLRQMSISTGYLSSCVKYWG